MSYEPLKEHIKYFGNNTCIGKKLKSICVVINGFIDQLGVEYSESVLFMPYLLGNLICALLNTILYFTDVVLGYEKDSELNPFCVWMTTDICQLGSSLQQMFVRGIVLNLLINLHDFVKDGVCRRPYNAYQAAKRFATFFCHTEKPEEDVNANNLPDIVALA